MANIGTSRSRRLPQDAAKSPAPRLSPLFSRLWYKFLRNNNLAALKRQPCEKRQFFAEKGLVNDQCFL